MSEFSSITEVLLELLKDITKLSENTYDLWFSGLELVSLDDEKAVLLSPSQLKRNILSQKYMPHIKEGLEKTLGFPSDLLLR